jgi:hypothetical protein
LSPLGYFQMLQAAGLAAAFTSPQELERAMRTLADLGYNRVDLMTYNTNHHLRRYTWREALAALPHGDVYWLPEYAAAYEDMGEGEAAAFVGHRAGAIVIHPVIVRDVTGMGWARITGVAAGLGLFRSPPESARQLRAR